MDIGKTKRIITIEPAVSPLPKREPAPTKAPEPVREPERVPA